VGGDAPTSELPVSDGEAADAAVTTPAERRP